MKAKHWILLGLAGLGLYYVPTIMAIVALDAKFVRLSILKIQSTYIRFGFTLNLANTKNVALTFQEINIKLFLNGKYVGNINNPIMQTIPGMMQQDFIFSLDLGYDQLGGAIWQALLNQQVENYRIDIAGTVRVNNKTFPVSALFGANDIKQALS